MKSYEKIIVIVKQCKHFFIISMYFCPQCYAFKFLASFLMKHFEFHMKIVIVIIFQSRNTLLNQVISSTELNARRYISESNETGKVVPFSTPNIEVRGIRLPAVKSTEPEDIVLVGQTGEGVVIPAVSTNELRQATVVKFSSIQTIFSDEELRESLNSSIKMTNSLTIRSSMISFTIKSELDEPMAKPYKIVLRNNQVYSSKIYST